MHLKITHLKSEPNLPRDNELKWIRMERVNLNMMLFFQNHHKASSHNQDIPFVYFDYHSECRGGNTKKLIKLRDRVKKKLEEFGFFHSMAGVASV